MDLAGATRATKTAEHQDGPIAAMTGEDMLRSQLYNLLSQFLWAAPSQQHLDIAASLDASGEGELAAALSRFAAAASRANEAVEENAYEALFIGLGRGKLVPYGSYYLTGFLNEKPLAVLRQTLASLGIERDYSRSEPEDHAASLMEIMSGLIDQRYGSSFSHQQQKLFFTTHVFSWMPHFFSDLEREQDESALFASLGTVGAAFLALEKESFDMLDDAPGAAS